MSTRERGLLRSTDGGTKFQAVGTELIDTNHLVADFSNPTSAPIQFSPTFATDRTVFAYAGTDVVRSTDGGRSWEVLRLPSSRDVLESLGHAPSAHANGVERRWFETPIGNLSMRRVLAAVAVGLACFAALVGPRCGRPTHGSSARPAAGWWCRRASPRVARAGGVVVTIGEMVAGPGPP